MIITYQYYQTKLLKKRENIIIVLIIYIRLVWILNICIQKQHCMYWKKKDLRGISGFYEIKMLHVNCTCICVYQKKKWKKCVTWFSSHFIDSFNKIFSTFKIKRKKKPDTFIIHIIEGRELSFFFKFEKWVFVDI